MLDGGVRTSQTNGSGSGRPRTETLIGRVPVIRNTGDPVLSDLTVLVFKSDKAS